MSVETALRISLILVVFVSIYVSVRTESENDKLKLQVIQLEEKLNGKVSRLVQ